MKIEQPITFEPLFMERVWGGRRLESLFGKHLPPTERIGESWEIVDREEAQSVVHDGPFRGKTLHELWCEYRAAVFGKAVPDAPRFPLLFKLLDAQERLSVQVHPPAAIAPELGGEPKTEMWFVVENHGEGDIFAGVKPGTSREVFEQALADGTVETQVHRVQVKAGDTMFIPSGRIHAIGAGNLIVEVQQNSDTTYRVFDWNRVSIDGKTRELHVGQSLRSIDFDDVAPALQTPAGDLLVECEYFRVERWMLDAPRVATAPGQFAIFTCLDGVVECGGAKFAAGDFFLVPATVENCEIKAQSGSATVLRTTIPG
ncbi:MAG: mannose-6-phosphate isomerase [Chthoniobacter sp.]|jgi:mannose-6-phosphate isomerase|nr:mannose-6-phosphate isomerase [Chthoniobacter sp.]